jgi:ribosome-associated protein
MTQEAAVKKDTQRLQRAIVDGLEDVKGQDIQVFNTEHLSPLFERVIIASGTSNRQTKALASSVRDAVKAKGGPLPRTEGEDNGEWIIVDCGPAVVHVMQPAIRDYYHLEEIWGGKSVKMKIDALPLKLVKPEVEAQAAPKKPAAKKAPAAAKTAAAKAPTRKAPAKKAAAKKAAARKAPAARRPVATKAAAKKTPARPRAR